MLSARFQRLGRLRARGLDTVKEILWFDWLCFRAAIHVHNRCDNLARLEPRIGNQPLPLRSPELCHFASVEDFPQLGFGNAVNKTQL